MDTEKETRRRSLDIAKRLFVFIDGLSGDIKDESPKEHILVKITAILTTLQDLVKNLQYSLEEPAEDDATER